MGPFLFLTEKITTANLEPTTNPTPNQLVIFNFDGVLVNTEYATFQYYQQILPNCNIHLKEKDFKYKIGRKSVDFFKSVMGHKLDLRLVEKLTEQKRNAFQRKPEKYVTPLPGAFYLVRKPALLLP